MLMFWANSPSMDVLNMSGTAVTIDEVLLSSTQLSVNTQVDFLHHGAD
ncbi:hypothetical protein I3843_07G143300 [Carya illinoinensis]|uniref:Uncharacterized protein n=1 Tax=Carya illinoinensis TaxID=32201 RepID=A0A922EKX1_CARIL|nr:hypothetical protein I3842_07G148500 [Carya illinoinensis]KAG7971608.1 hypothetical protein I3843_07G143300 [Carya illinoinensis]